MGLFDVDLSKCLFCGLCEETCPEGCIVLDPVYDYSSYSRDGLYLTIEGLRRDATEEEWRAMQEAKEAKKREAEARRKAREEAKAKAEKKKDEG